MGGMVAFEMAQQLKAAGEDIALLALVQAAMPGFPVSRLQRLHMRYQHRWSLCKTLVKFLFVRSAPDFLKIPRAVKQLVLDEVSKLILGWHGTSAKLPDETQTSNSLIMYAYKPRLYEGSVHLILAEDCYESFGIGSSLDPRRAWSGVVTGKCVTHVVGGDHNSMLANGNAAGLAQCMRTLLDEASKGHAL
jgi:thioesterase domain-containing protein